MIHNLTSVISTICVHKSTVTHCVSKNRLTWYIVHTPYLCQILTNFQNSFAGTLTGQFAIKWFVMIAPHFISVAMMTMNSDKVGRFFERVYISVQRAFVCVLLCTACISLYVVDKFIHSFVRSPW